MKSKFQFILFGLFSLTTSLTAKSVSHNNWMIKPISANNDTVLIQDVGPHDQYYMCDWHVTSQYVCTWHIGSNDEGSRWIITEYDGKTPVKSVSAGINYKVQNVRSKRYLSTDGTFVTQSVTPGYVVFTAETDSTFSIRANNKEVYDTYCDNVPMPVRSALVNVDGVLYWRDDLNMGFKCAFPTEFVGTNTEVTIPKSVEFAEEQYEVQCTGYHAFDATITNAGIITKVNLPQTVFCISDASFAGCSSLADINLTNSITYIGPDAFNGCLQLNSLVLPSSVKEIYEGAFAHCGLTNMQWNNSLAEIPSWCFLDNKLTSLTIPEGVKRIKWGAFDTNPLLETVYLPSSLENLERYAFTWCEKIKNTYVAASNPPAMDCAEGGWVFNATNMTIHVPKGYLSAYQSADNWKDLNLVDDYVPNPLTSISLNASEATCEIGKNVNLSVSSYEPQNATYPHVKWTSSNTGIATVSEDGIVNGLAEGSVIITATADDGSGITAQCQIHVGKPLVQSIQLATENIVMYPNHSVTLSYLVSPSTADNTLLWSSMNTDVCTVKDGKISGLTKGATTIVATSTDGSGKSVTCNVRVVDPTDTTVNLDINNDGKISVSDVSKLVNYILGVKE